jgi:hypothetical protein
MRIHAVHTHRHDAGHAFMGASGGGAARIDDDLAEELAEEFLWAATCSDDAPTEHARTTEQAKWTRGRSRHGRSR